MCDLEWLNTIMSDIMHSMLSGGNVDDRRMGIGATMYYPVAVEGALLSMGDTHSAQGDSEFDGKLTAEARCDQNQLLGSV